jgi:pimeloyl-ACP methyl ester carboxylesterase
MTKRLFARGLAALATAALFAGLAASARAEGFKAEVKYAQVGDIKMAYYTRGQGDPLIMIMGAGGTMGDWDPALLDALDDTNTLILFDNRGCGLSADTAEDNTTIPQMADDTAGLLEAIGYEKVNVLGWSMGARIAQQVVIRHPDQVMKAVFAAPNPGGTMQVKAAESVEMKLNDPSVPVTDKTAFMFPDTDAGRTAAKQSLARLAAAQASGEAPNDMTCSPQAVQRQDRARTTLWTADTTNFRDLANIRLPVLVADGRDDIIDPPQNSSLIAAQIPFAWLAFYEGGHAFLYQSAEKFGGTVNLFLSK